MIRGCGTVFLLFLVLSIGLVFISEKSSEKKDATVNQNRAYIPYKQGVKKEYKTFTEKDFTFDKKTSNYKKTIIDGVNKAHRENEDCYDIDPSSAYIAKTKGTKSNPSFYVSCGSQDKQYNFFFSKSDIDNGIALSTPVHFDQTKAIRMCEQYAKQISNHPSTVNFSRVMDLQVTQHPGGRTTILSTFTAKNSFNLEVKMNVRCLIDEFGGMLEAKAWE